MIKNTLIKIGIILLVILFISALNTLEQAVWF